MSRTSDHRSTDTLSLCPASPLSTCLFCSRVPQQNALTAAQSAEQSEALMESREMILMLQAELHGVTSERDDFRDHLERVEIDRQGLLQQLEVQHDNTSEASVSIRFSPKASPCAPSLPTSHASSWCGGAPFSRESLV